MDDAWIHAQFAVNVAQGHLFQFQPGTLSTGSTSPLWSLLMGVGLVLWPDPVAVGHALGVVFSWAVVAWTLLLAHRLGLPSAVRTALPVLLVLQWRLTWTALSGMEVPLFSWLILVTLWTYLGEQGSERCLWRTGFLAGLACWARPEGLLLGALVVLFEAFSGLGTQAKHLWMVARSRRWRSFAASWALIVVPLGAFHAAVGPGIFPRPSMSSRSRSAGIRAWPISEGIFSN